MCTGNNITVTNCTGMYDACQTSGLHISLKLPKLKMDMRMMSCSMKSACSKITTDGCKNVTSLTKAVPGSKVDACGVSCCYTDKCNTKDLVVLSTPTAKSVAPFSEVSLIINLVFLLSAGIATLCSKLETENCGPEGVRKYVDKIPGVKVTKCGVACCQTDMCNNKDLVKPKPLPPVALAAFTSASLMASCISLLLGFALMV
ncbi:unnamed protein product [Pocillopora meandrina]|uniref:UPAR/Ly6 domain-containing protein n=1 Tax=Pocillopora meandrina TaxID=46732 RepID=A0AAU9WMD5_9CNID|nr:unnamed protein product [Pocillopora meandrina]